MLASLSERLTRCSLWCRPHESCQEFISYGVGSCESAIVSFQFSQAISEVCWRSLIEDAFRRRAVNKQIAQTSCSRQGHIQVQPVIVPLCVEIARVDHCSSIVQRQPLRGCYSSILCARERQLPHPQNTHKPLLNTC